MPLHCRISVFLEHMLTSNSKAAYVSLPVTLLSPLGLDGGVVVDWSHQLTAVFHDKYERTQQVIEVAHGHHVHWEHTSQGGSNVRSARWCTPPWVAHTPQLDTRAPADKMPPAAPRYRPLLNGPAEPYHTPVFFLFPLFYSTLSLVFTIYILWWTFIVFGPPEWFEATL